MNQGLNNYDPKEGATVLKNVFSIPSNSDVYRSYFQSNDFTVLSDAYAIKWKYNNREITNDQYDDYCRHRAGARGTGGFGSTSEKEIK